MRNELQAAVSVIGRIRLQTVESAENYTHAGVPRNDMQEEIDALDTALAALRDALKREEGCDTCRKGQAHFGDVLWAINKDGNAVININGEQANTVFPYCPMCGRKLTAPPRPGAIGQDAGEMDPNGDEGARV